MSPNDDVRAELQELARAYIAGTRSLSDILTFEVEYSDLDLEIDDTLRRQLTWLSLRGNEYLMNMRPLSDFDEVIREVLAEADSAAADAAAG